MIKRQKSILYVQYPWRMARVRLGGIYRYAKSAGWRVEVAEYGRSTESIPKMLEFWNPDGCIVEGGCLRGPDFDLRPFSRIPTVYFDAILPNGRCKLPAVCQEAQQPVDTAVNELLSLGFRNCAYVGYLRPRLWSDQRRECFRRLMREHNCDHHIFDSRGSATIDEFIERLVTFLESLPKPCGIVAVNDLVGDIILHCCGQMDIAVPESIAVVGMDNDKLICENSRPTLTSVPLDFEGSGYLAASMLDEYMADPRTKKRLETFGALPLVRRASTHRFTRRDEAVLKAIERIRTEACDGLMPREVVAGIGGSRRNAEMRFRALTGKSIGDAIIEQRLARAKELLRDRNMPIELIYARCGYLSNGSLRKAFHKVSGCSLREWRDNNCA